MPHISVESPTLSSKQKRELIEKLREDFAAIADINIESISISIIELPDENMNDFDTNDRKESSTKKPAKSKQQEEKKSLFRELFPK